MGGCAGKMKGSADDLPPEPLPSEAPVSHTEAEGETVVQEKEVGEKPTEAPLVDLSEPKQEGENSSAEPKTEEDAAEHGKKEETAAATSEEKVEAAAVAAEEPAKDTENEEIEAAVPTKEEEKSDAPIVIV